MRALLALLLLSGPLLGQAANGWAPIENGWGEVQVPSSVSAPSGLTSGRVTLSTGATSVGDDAGCTWSGTGNAFLLSASGVLAGPGTIKIGYDSGSGDYGLHLASFTKVGWSSTVGPSGAPDLAISRPSAGLLLVEDGSGSPRDVQARTGTFGTSVVTPTVSSSTTTTTLTESSATSFATLTYSASSTVGAEFLVRVRANDATDFQVLTSRVRVSSVRKATGNTVSAIGVVGTDLLAESAGGSTLSCTFTVVEGASAATLQANCVSSLTQTTLNLSLLAETVGGPVTIAQL